MIAATDVVAAIRADHLKTNIGRYERDRLATIHWFQATVDWGGTMFGAGPYLKVPVSHIQWETDTVILRVYAPVQLQRRLTKLREG